MSDLATLTIEGTRATLTLNRPEARNALSLDLLAALHARLAELDELLPSPDAPRVLVLSGAGRSFCAGMDLKQVLSEPGAPLRLLTLLAEFCQRLRALPIVTIAAVNGAAIGGGCGIATVADLSVTHADSKMGFPEVDLGVCPAVVAPWLVRRIGAGRARAVLLRGGLMSGQEALAIGMVTQCVGTQEELEMEVTRLAGRIASGGPKALAATKTLLNELDGSIDSHLSTRGAELSALVLESPEAQAMLRSRMG